MILTGSDVGVVTLGMGIASASNCTVPVDDVDDCAGAQIAGAHLTAGAVVETAGGATFGVDATGVSVGVTTGVGTDFTIGAGVGTLGAIGALKLVTSGFTTGTGFGCETVNSAGAGAGCGAANICVLVFGTDFGIGSLSVKLGAGADGAGATIVGTLAVWTTVGGARTGCPIAAPESRQLMSSTSVVGFPIV